MTTRFFRFFCGRTTTTTRRVVGRDLLREKKLLPTLNPKILQP